MNQEAITASLPATSRVWVYMADRPLTVQEAAGISRELQSFTEGWAAHGKSLAAAGEVRHNRFLVLAVDESAYGASGCSIDTSVHFVRDLEGRYGVGFFNRMLVGWINGSGEVVTAPMQDLKALYASGKVHDGTLVFNNLVGTLGELDSAWQVPLRESVYARML